ncbi:unannotated protein [freshwater metagenome]|uniref:Unannotated protein n=1 Tax=freshwater metagenome TaxID=449393 RepID=A0A6J7HNL7_9ZZZZ
MTALGGERRGPGLMRPRLCDAPRGDHLHHFRADPRRPWCKAGRSSRQLGDVRDGAVVGGGTGQHSIQQPLPVTPDIRTVVRMLLAHCRSPCIRSIYWPPVRACWVVPQAPLLPRCDLGSSCYRGPETSGSSPGESRIPPVRRCVLLQDGQFVRKGSVFDCCERGVHGSLDAVAASVFVLRFAGSYVAGAVLGELVHQGES